MDSSLNSILWSVPKHKWLAGPSTNETKFRFINACAVAMNVSSVLFVGLSKKEEINPVNGSTTLNMSFQNWIYVDKPGNNITAIYNFELNRWQQQDSLYFNHSLDVITEYSYELTCSILHEKTGNR